MKRRMLEENLDDALDEHNISEDLFDSPERSQSIETVSAPSREYRTKARVEEYESK